jgi:hypothetical protein
VVIEDDAKDSRLEQRTREAFENSVANLDGRTRSRLNQARQHALAIAAKGAPPRWRRTLLPATGLAAAAVAALILQLSPSKVAHHPETLAFEDLDIVSDADNLDLMQDIDFYAWMPQSNASAQ